MKMTTKRLQKACDYLNGITDIDGGPMTPGELAESLGVEIDDRLIVIVEYDHDMECPNDMDCQWKLYCWDTRYRNSERPVSVGTNEDDWTVFNPGLRTKLRVGLAFWLRYSEHGICSWDIGSNDKPDGILIWEHTPSEIGGKTYAARQRDAEAFLRIYTDWCNGSGYGYTIKDGDGEHAGGCWGYYGSDLDYMTDEILRELDGRPFVLKGEGKDAVEVSLDSNNRRRNRHEQASTTRSEGAGS